MPSPGLRLDFAGLEARADELDALAAETPGIDRFCSGAAWTLSAREAFAPGAEPVIARGDGGLVALMRIENEEGVPLLAPLEASWGLACPLLGPEPRALAADVAALAATPPYDRLPLVLMGLPRRGPLLAAVLARVGVVRILRPATDSIRVVADLAGGVDAYLARQGGHFRAAVRRAERAAARAGLELEALRPTTGEAAMALLARARAVETRSWKGLEGSGLLGEELATFNEGLLRRLAPRGLVRALVLRRGDDDLGFVFGAVEGTTYRGLQASFDATLRRASPGLVLHAAMMRVLAAEGVVRYDLGSDMPYKRRFGAPGLVTTSLVAFPRRRRVPPP